mmetsp:Transcript_14517/g.34766  ORF Transcript_14517/g.34766 Transcript_14517/m.34766 type:complete len:267 (-) Transcript_14517:252-1052(-)
MRSPAIRRGRKSMYRIFNASTTGGFLEPAKHPSRTSARRGFCDWALDDESALSQLSNSSHMPSKRFEYRSTFSCPISPSRPLSISSTNSSAQSSPPNREREASPSYRRWWEATRNSSKCRSPSGCVFSTSSIKRATLWQLPSFPHVQSAHWPNERSRSESSNSREETVPDASASTASKILRAATTQESSRPRARTLAAASVSLLLASSRSSLLKMRSPATRTGPRSSYRTLNASVTCGSFIAADVPPSRPRYRGDATRLMSAGVCL